LSRVRSILRSAATFRARNRVVPAASSMKCRISSGFALTSCSTRPCSMIAYAFVPTPVPRKSSVMSFRRHGAWLMKYSESPERSTGRVTRISLAFASSGGRPSGPAFGRDLLLRLQQVFLAPLEEERHLGHAERSEVGRCR
jgi:hypothetical protein